MIRIRIKCNHGLITAFSLSTAPAFINQLSSQIIHDLCYWLFWLLVFTVECHLWRLKFVCKWPSDSPFWCHRKSNKILVGIGLSEILLSLFNPCAVLSYLMSLFQIVGLNTNISFLLSLAKHPEFQLGNVHTEFIPQHNESLFPKR